MYAQLFVTMLAVTVIPVLLIQVFYTNYIVKMIRDNRVEIVREYSALIAGEMLRQKYLEGTGTELVNGEIAQFCGLYDGRGIVTDKDYYVRLDTYGMMQGQQLVSEEAVMTMKGKEVSRYDRPSDQICITYAVRNARDEIEGMLLFVVSCADLTRICNRMIQTMSYVLIGVGGILVFLSYRLSKRFTTPFNTLTKTINSISGGNFDEEVKLVGFNEVEEMSDAYNKMLIRLKSLEDSRQEFVSNVSHELKTPLTSMKVLADSLNMQQDLPVELYQEFMQDITAEIDRETTIINDLLSLVKMDKTSSDLNVSEVNINEMLESVVKRLRPIAAKRNVRLELEMGKKVTAPCDEIKLSLALSNLVENAIKYNVASGWVHVSLDSDEQFFFVTVADSGIGIPQEYQEKIFDRFYRVDKARSRESGGTGLGLAITKNVIQMHHGAIKVSSKEDQGTTFSVRIPLVYTPSAEKEAEVYDR